MLRQISLEIRPENDFQAVAKAHAVTISVTDCRAFNDKGMTMLLEIGGRAESVRAAVTSVRKMHGVRQVFEGEDRGDGRPLLVVLDRPSICRASSDAAIICLECPFSSPEEPAMWKFIARRTSDLRQIMANLGREGIQARIEDVSPLDQKATLTTRQKEIMATAMARGYFDFPRKISLTGLSQLVGVKPSTLSEILRSAERRIMINAIDVPISENTAK
jgi:predicted DNA binding protein